jgi:thioredoxin reductase (NADPH)
LTKDIGGQATLTPVIENYPGFETISGPELMQKFQGQAERFGTKFRYEEVKQINKMDDEYGDSGHSDNGFDVCDIDIEDIWFTVKTNVDEYECLSVILAFGKTPRDLEVAGEGKLVGRGVSYCAVCDAPLNKERTTAVVGWREPAMDAVMMLCPISSKSESPITGSAS